MLLTTVKHVLSVSLYEGIIFLSYFKEKKKEIEYKKEMGSFVVRKCKTLDELITEYVALYGKENWALSTYEGNVSLINNYILPIIGDTKLSEINTRFIERYYQSLLKRRAVINPLNKTS